MGNGMPRRDENSSERNGAMTLYSKANLVVGAVASGDPFDRALNGVRFEPDGSTAAGNGKVLMAVGPADEDRVHFPDVGTRATPGGKGIVLSVDFVNEALKNLPKDKRISLQHTAMTQGRDPVKTEFTCVTAGGRERKVADYPKRERYPDWKEVARKVRGTEPVKVCLNRRDLIDLLKALEAACPDKGDENPVFVEIGKGVVLRCFNRETGQHALGAINAFNTRGQWMEQDTWEDSIFTSAPKKKVVIKRRK